MSKDKRDENIPDGIPVECPNRFTGSEEQAKAQAGLWASEAKRLREAMRELMAAGDFDGAMNAGTQAGAADVQAQRWADKAKPDTNTAVRAVRSATKYAVEALTDAGKGPDDWRTLFANIGETVAKGGNGDQARGVVLDFFAGTSAHAMLKSSMEANMKKAKEGRTK